jgi:mannose-1-phosphate guanylyltransferase
LKAILLAAGFGTRLRPLTDNIPKCLVPIKGKPLLEIWLEKLKEVGIDDILVNTHYLSNKVEEFIQKSNFKNNCKLKHEEELLGTAGTLVSNINFIGQDDCILIHADNYCLEDLKNLVKAHENRPLDCKLTMMTFQTDEPSKCGIIEIDDRNVVIGFHEKINNPPGNLANAAVYILSQDFITELIEKNIDYFDFSREVVPEFLNRIFCYQTNKLFLDIGTPENYKKANERN